MKNFCKGKHPGNAEVWCSQCKIIVIVISKIITIKFEQFHFELACTKV